MNISNHHLISASGISCNFRILLAIIGPTACAYARIETIARTNETLSVYIHNKTHFLSINSFFIPTKVTENIEFWLANLFFWGEVGQWTSKKVKYNKGSEFHFLPTWDAGTVDHDWWMLWGTSGSITDHWASDLANSTRQHSKIIWLLTYDS